MTTQQQTVLDKLNAIDLDAEADLCEKLHEHAEHLYESLSVRLGDVPGGE